MGLRDLLAGAALVAAAAGCTGKGAHAGPGAAPSRAADLQLADPSGAPHSLAELEGRPVLVNLWATWCGPCVTELPLLADLQREHAGGDLQVVGISVDARDARGKVESFLGAQPLPYPVWLDPEGRSLAVFEADALPTSVLLDRAGRAVWRRDGPIAKDDPELRTQVAAVLASP